MIQLVSKADTLLVSLADMKLYLRVTQTAENALIEGFIRNAQNSIENYTSRALTINTYKYIYEFSDLDNYDYDKIKLKKGKITEIVSIKTYDSDGTETSYTISDFDIFNFDQYSYIVQKDGSDIAIGAREYAPLIIEFKAGYSTDLPHDIKQAILKLVANYYEYRESFSPENMTEVPAGLRNILNKYRLEALV